MEKTMKLSVNMIIIILCVLVSLSASSSACVDNFNPRRVPITLLHNNEGAACLDGSPPSYYFDAGDGDGINNWVVYLQGGGWCISAEDCFNRTAKSTGSSKHSNITLQLGEILSKSSKFNPDFCSWNRVFINYCDGSSFTGDVEIVDPVYNLTYRGARNFKVIMEDLLSKGMKNAKNAILAGSSAGGVATIIHCDRFRSLFSSANVKCFADSGNFLHEKYLMGEKKFDSTFEALISLHGSSPNLPSTCIAKSVKPSLCFFPQYILPGLTTPLFMAMSSFDQIQIQFNLSPDHEKCLLHKNCTSVEMASIQALRLEFLHSLPLSMPTSFRGIWTTSCMTHDLFAWGWIPPNAPTNNSNLVYSKAFGDWFYDRLAANVLDLSDEPKNCTQFGINDFPS